MRRWIVGLLAIASLSAAVARAQPPHAGVPARALPPPRFGHTLDIGLVSGTVIVTPPGRQPFKLGVQDRIIPVGSLLDTTHGRIDLRAAPFPASTTGTGRTAKVEDAEFYTGKFTVRQRAGTGVTQILLAGGNPSVCSQTARSPAQRRALPHRVLRLLGRERQVPDAGALRRRDRARDGVDDHRLLRRHAGERAARRRVGPRPRAPQDRHRDIRPQLLRQGIVGRVSRAARAATRTRAGSRCPRTG
jgi:hypothetical protein